jgi:hypothetical protein
LAPLPLSAGFAMSALGTELTEPKAFTNLNVQAIGHANT